MFFAYLCLRPSLSDLAAMQRAALWSRVLGRFFGWVLIAVPTLLLTGLWMSDWLRDADLHIHLMFGLGVTMMLLFLHVYFAPFRRLRRAIVAGDADASVRAIGQIRRLVAVNLALGLCVVLDATAGKYLLAYSIQTLASGR
jgi:uncharacterized membrane protein